MCKNKYLKDKKYCKFRDHCHYNSNIEVMHIAYVTLKVVLPKKYSYYFS